MGRGPREAHGRALRLPEAQVAHGRRHLGRIGAHRAAVGAAAQGAL